MPAYSEEQILAGCRDKKRAYQEQLYCNYYSLFLKICARYARNMLDAEQLLNDGFLKIFNSIDQYKNAGSFEGWMKKIIDNTCLDYLRLVGQKEEMSMSEKSVPAEESNVSVSNYCIENMEFKEMVRLIQSISPVSRTVFNLYVFEGYNHKEISEQLNISIGTSQWHLHYARTFLQEKIKKSEHKIKSYETRRI